MQALKKQLAIRKGALPILKNKESALRVEVIAQKSRIKKLTDKLQEVEQNNKQIVPYLAQFPFNAIKITNVDITRKKIAGITIPVFQSINLSPTNIYLAETQHWFINALHFVNQFIALQTEITVAQKQLEILEHERKRTTQKVNLYEKVQIPELQDAQKKIKRFLEDEQNLSKAAQKMVKARTEAA